jgi:hypothetical protein
MASNESTSTSFVHVLKALAAHNETVKVSLTGDTSDEGKLVFADTSFIKLIVHGSTGTGGGAGSLHTVFIPVGAIVAVTEF